MQIAFSAHTSAGRKRTSNQDRYLAHKVGEWYVFAICDGMGGHSGGAVAADMAVETIRSFTPGSGKQRTALTEMILELNNAIIERGKEDPALSFMGTTLTMGLLSAAECWFCHIGDSRLYRARQGVLEQLTSDHRFLQEYIDAGELSEAEAAAHQFRSQLDQALGMPEIEPEIGMFEVIPEDLLLLCSDGVSDELTRLELAKILDGKKNIDLMGEEIIKAALDAGGRDNITALVALIER